MKERSKRGKEVKGATEKKPMRTDEYDLKWIKTGMNEDDTN